MKNAVITYYQKHPLRFILIAALLIRMVAVVYSKGYGMHDDHFLTVEPAQAWAEGKTEYNSWLDPSRAEQTAENPSGHSLFYPGSLYVFFKICQKLGMEDPQVKMYFMRLIHALFSLLIVYFSYLIAQKLKNEKTAKTIGWLMALFWLFPVASVHNFVEIVCIPPMLAASWYLLLYDEDKKIKNIVLSALWISVALAIRFQVWFFFAGIGGYFLMRARWIHGILYLFATLFFYFITQLPDWYIFGEPFVMNQNYFEYNMKHAEDFTNHPFYQYFLIVSALTIPPFSLLLWAGFFTQWKKSLPVLAPALFFFLIHSYFPNKQERFILPFIPYLILLGVIGWIHIIETKKAWFTNAKLLKPVYVFFVIINIFGLILLTPSYSKRSRVESMYYLSQFDDVNALIIENSHDDYSIQPPMFYLGDWVYYEQVPKGYPLENLYVKLGKEYKTFPHYILFVEDKKLQERVEQYQKIMHQELEFLTEIESGFLDKLMYRLNPKNRNFTIYIYRIKPF